MNDMLLALLDLFIITAQALFILLMIGLVFVGLYVIIGMWAEMLDARRAERARQRERDDLGL